MSVSEDGGTGIAESREYDGEKGEGSLHYRLPMTLRAVDNVGERLANDLEQRGFDAESILKAELLFEELCSNAILHDRSQCGDTIYCMVECRHCDISMTLWMPGEFFDLRQKLEHLVPDEAFERLNNGLVPNGRGLPIIKNCSSSLDFKRHLNMNKVTFTINSGGGTH